MAFNLKKVIRALLFSSTQPLTTKDIQATFARFHDSEEADGKEPAAAQPLAGSTAGAQEGEAATAVPAAAAVASAVVAQASAAAAEDEDAAQMAFADDVDDALYCGVPSLVTAAQIRDAMDAIAAELREADEGLLLIEGSSGYRLVTHPRFARWVRLLRGEPAPARLSRSALETLAIVAYRQPVTRGEIETIRGVSADAGLNKLIERELVYIVGRAELPGRPIQYGTTDQFLEFVGLRSLDELPASDVLSNRQIDEWLQASAEAAAAPATDATMGLPLEAGEGETPNLEEVSIEPEALASDESRAASAAAAEGTQGPDVESHAAAPVSTTHEKEEEPV
ncbi:segregation and condensation protein B [Cephaloticoccus primus]|uniref:Segregation and condensation protein B n=1 Tax=Cephaloticoccus primus TaxID=1548207 RepID=A0A139SKN7_9BACT|nr:SMC-Scp complex subunit ScpB [Cephaloticoccus primus]KXU35121.1 segregation and condensation protein B [Cephaloticoccus primus]